MNGLQPGQALVVNELPARPQQGAKRPCPWTTCDSEPGFGEGDGQSKVCLAGKPILGWTLLFFY